MRATILPYAIILTKANRAAVSLIAKGIIGTRVLPLRCFFFLLPDYIIFLCVFFYLHCFLTSLK